jgi:hypothetical protein
MRHAAAQASNGSAQDKRLSGVGRPLPVSRFEAEHNNLVVECCTPHIKA